MLNIEAIELGDRNRRAELCTEVTIAGLPETLRMDRYVGEWTLQRDSENEGRRISEAAELVAVLAEFQGICVETGRSLILVFGGENPWYYTVPASRLPTLRVL